MIITVLRRVRGVYNGAMTEGSTFIYMKHGTETPLDPRVRHVMLPLLDEDPRGDSGLLRDGRAIRRVLQEARLKVASAFGARPGEIVFTSGGTEACNLALKGACLAKRGRGATRPRILVGAAERTAVLYPARTLGRAEAHTELLPVDRHGRVRLDILEDRLAPGTLLVSVATANAETGTLDEIEAIARMAHEHGALMHTDAGLAAAYRPMDLGALGVDLASLSAHPMGGPRGAGALFVREGVRIAPLIEGGTGERGLRGGGQNVAALAGFGAAAEILSRELPAASGHAGDLGAALETALLAVPGVHLNGHPELRLRGMVNVSVESVDGEALLMRLARHGIAASSGSSCYQETGKPSHVLLAMGVDPALAQGSVLFSLGRGNTEQDVTIVASRFGEAVVSLRALSAGTPT